MDTGLIIAIVVIALILLALVAFVLPRMRRNSQVKARERELEHRREHRAEEHRTEAAERRNEAEMAEQRAKMAAAEAERERAEAQMREQRAEMHERGMADHELIDDNERDRFAGTSATADGPAPMRDDAERRDETGRPMHEPTSDYEQGRVDERNDEQAGRFERRPTDDRTRSA
jgi:FtsZ-interacting cell division protein ZipA